MPSSSTPPPTAMHGMPAASARLATPERGLAEPGLGVDPALAGDDEVGLRQSRVEVGRLHQEVDAGAEGEPGERVLDRQQREADAAGRTGTRRVAFAPTRRGLEGIGPILEGLLEDRVIVGSRRPSAVRTWRSRRTGRGAGC